MAHATQERRVGYPSLYEFSSSYWDVFKNLGHDYGENLFKNTFSNYMFRNINLSTFLIDYLQPIMVKYINTVKYLRIYYNYAVPKDYQKIN